MSDYRKMIVYIMEVNVAKKALELFYHYTIPHTDIFIQSVDYKKIDTYSKTFLRRNNKLLLNLPHGESIFLNLFNSFSYFYGNGGWNGWISYMRTRIEGQEIYEKINSQNLDSSYRIIITSQCQNLCRTLNLFLKNFHVFCK